MDWTLIDKHTLKSDNPRGYTIAKNKVVSKTIYEAYGPRSKDGQINLLDIKKTADDAKAVCLVHSQKFAAPEAKGGRKPPTQSTQQQS